MPHYFFHVRDGERILRDLEGLDFENEATALEEARAAAVDMLDDALATGADVSEQVILVVDGHDRTIGTVLLRELIELDSLDG